MEKTIVLSFDDAVTNHYGVVAPLLHRFGFGATFFICDFINAPKAAFMTPEQIVDLYRQGFEIGNHTLTHTLGNDRAVIEKEIVEREKRIMELGIPKPRTFAYPGGPYNAIAAEILRERGYLAARTCQRRAVVDDEDPLCFPSFPIHVKSGDNFEQAVALADAGKLTSLVYHGVPELLHDWVDTQPEVFVAQMTVLQEHRIKVISLGAVFGA